MKHWLYVFVISSILSSCVKGKPDFVYSHRPVIFVHGFLASGDTYEKQAKRFASNGYPLDRLYAFDWNSLGSANNELLLDKFIDSIRVLTGAETIDLVGHSAGSGLVYSYSASSLTRAKKIEHLVLLAGTIQSQPGGPNGELPTLNIYSTADLIATGGADIPDADNIRLTDKDHYQVATCEETFEAMYSLFNTWQEPSTTDITPDANIVLSGKAASFGENIARAGTQVEIYSLDATTGFRLNASPDETFTTNALGNWGPFTAQANTYYEFVVSNPGVIGDRVIHYYREPFTRSDKLVYLRSYPTGASIAALFLASLPKNDNQSVTAFFGASQAAIAGRDDLKINGTTLSTNTFCDAANTTIALFAYDANNNSTSDVTAIPAFSLFPFLNGADMFFPTVSPQSITFEFNGRVQKARNWKSNTEGVSVAVFE